MHGSEAISDPGGVRPMVARWVITADLILETAAHFGAGSGDAADMTLLRDARDGCPLLTGTSQGGALRSHLADALGGYRSSEDERVAQLFGGVRGDDRGTQSPLLVFDSLGVLPESSPVELRDGVQIDAKCGTAEEHKKFDFEVLPAGTLFPLRFELVVAQSGDEADLVSLFVTSLSGLGPGEMSLGARRSRGLGALNARHWRAFRHDLTSAAGWLDWLTSDAQRPIPLHQIPEASDAAAAVRAARPELQIKTYEDKRQRVVVRAQLHAEGGILVRSAPTRPNAPDAVHLESAGRCILPGTSLAGVLRGRALRIAHVVRKDKGDARLWVDRLFGPRMEGTEDPGARKLWASRLRISESVIDGGTRVQATRIRIDRFTQGVFPGALFDEEPDHEGTVSVRFELRDPKHGETGLLFLLLKDLLAGDLPVGGASAVGRGVLKGVAEVQTEDGSRFRLDPITEARTQSKGIDNAISEFWDWESPSSEESHE